MYKSLSDVFIHYNVLIRLYVRVDNGVIKMILLPFIVLLLFLD